MTITRDDRSHEAEKVRALLASVADAFKAKPFRPHQLFKSGHAQTIAAYAWPRSYRFNIPKDVERLFELEPGVKVLAHCRWQEEPAIHPTLVLWHGIEGSTSSIYMIATADKAFRAGFNVVRVNFRNCGGTENLSPTLYHGGMSDDLRAVVRELIEQDGLPKLLLIGFSLGGNLVLKLAGEYGEDVPREVLGVCAVSPSVDLQASADLIGRRSNWIYQRDFVRRLKRRIYLKHRLYPGRYDLNKITLVNTVRDFDEHFTASAHGFANADDYYFRSSSIRVMAQIRVPTLIIHAHDDPFIPFAPLRSSVVSDNPHILLLDTKQGGHVAFISKRSENDASGNHAVGDEDRFWAENRVVEFCRLVVNFHIRNLSAAQPS